MISRPAGDTGAVSLLESCVLKCLLKLKYGQHDNLIQTNVSLDHDTARARGNLVYDLCIINLIHVNTNHRLSHTTGKGQPCDHLVGTHARKFWRLLLTLGSAQESDLVYYYIC